MGLINTFFGVEGSIHTEFKRLDSYSTIDASQSQVEQKGQARDGRCQIA